MTRDSASLPSQVGRYQVVRSLGRGSMGQVLLAHDPVLDRPVAIKHLRDDLSLTGEQFGALTRRMEHEARAAARVSHPHLVALHDMGRDPIVGLFLVFEYVAGETLEQRLQRGPLSAREAARLSRELGGALGVAHAAQVLHRDVKPENVLLGEAGAKLVDFGIARLPGSSLTRPGGLLGTPAYSAPEAIDQGEFSAHSDQFSLACTLFEAISAQRAFPGDDALEVARLLQTAEPARLAGPLRLDARVDEVLARALSKQPAVRFPSCEELGRALAEALEIPPRASLITVPDGQHRALAAPRRRLAGSVAGALLLGLAGSAVAAGAYQRGYRISFASPGSSEPAAAQATLDAELRPIAWLYERARRAPAPEPVPEPEVRSRALSPQPPPPPEPATASAADASTEPDAGGGPP